MSDESGDATVVVPGPAASPKPDLYRTIGETVNVSASTEWIVRRLAQLFADDLHDRDLSAVGTH